MRGAFVRLLRAERLSRVAMSSVYGVAKCGQAAFCTGCLSVCSLTGGVESELRTRIGRLCRGRLFCGYNGSCLGLFRRVGRGRVFCVACFGLKCSDGRAISLKDVDERRGNFPSSALRCRVRFRGTKLGTVVGG